MNQVSNLPEVTPKHTHICPCCILAETTGEGRTYECSDPECSDISEYTCIHCATDGERDLSASSEDYEGWTGSYSRKRAL